MHTTKLVEGEVCGWWLADSSLHICHAHSPSPPGPDRALSDVTHPLTTPSPTGSFLPEYHSEYTCRRQPRKPGLVVSWPPCHEALHKKTQEPGLTSYASRHLSFDANVEANRIANGLPTTCNECANNGLKEPVFPFGRNRMPGIVRFLIASDELHGIQAR